MELKSGTVTIDACEADLVLLSSSFPHSGKPLELVIAECKDAGGEITEDDVGKLAAWYEAKSLDEEKAIARRLNKAAFDHVIYAPVGWFLAHQA
jgi:hypothetical protein